MCHRIVAFAGSIPQGYSAILSLVLSDKYIKFAFSKVSYITYQYVTSLIENYMYNFLFLTKWWWQWRRWPLLRRHSPQAIWQLQDIQHGLHNAKQSSPPVVYGCLSRIKLSLFRFNQSFASFGVQFIVLGPCLQHWGQHPGRWGLEPCHSGRKRLPRANTFFQHCPSPGKKSTK